MPIDWLARAGRSGASTAPVPVPRSTWRRIGRWPGQAAPWPASTSSSRTWSERSCLPARGIVAEIACGRLGTAAADLFQPRQVAGQDGVGAGQQVDDGAGQGAAHVLLAQAEEHPVAFLVAADQAGLRHQLQVAADARLALAQDLGQLADIGLAMGEEKQDPDPGRLGGGAQAGQQFIH